MPVISGTAVLLEVDTDPGAPTVYAVMAAQRDLNVAEANETIDFSSKDAREMVVQAGRYSSEVTLDAAYIPSEAAYAALETAQRAGLGILIRQQVSGSPDEVATGIITAMDRAFPDQGASIASISLAITGAWA